MQVGILYKIINIPVVMVMSIVILSWLSFNMDNVERVSAIAFTEKSPSVQYQSVYMLEKQIFSPDGLICNQNLQISLGSECEAVLSPYMMLSNTTPGCCDNYLVNILDNQNLPIGNIANADMLGNTWTVEVKDTLSGDICYAQGITFVDTSPPVINCNDTTITCVDDIDDIPLPEVTDSCDDSPVIQLTSATYLDNNFCDDDTLVYQKTWTAFDVSGNQSPSCIQQIFIKRLSFVLPEDIVWTCDQYASFSNITDPTALHGVIVDTDVSDGQDDVDVDKNLADSLLSNTGSGVPTSYAEGTNSCDYNIVYSDQILDDCGAGTFQILRHWTILDQCTNQVANHYQVISVSDIDGPVMIPTDTVVVSADIPSSGTQFCKSTGFIIAPDVQDNCSGFQSMQIFTSLGEVVNYQFAADGRILGGYIPLPGLELGSYSEGITYYATDSCGNVSVLTAPIKVIDDISPSMSCESNTQVILSNGSSGIPAIVFDDGSTDNCCLDHFEVKRVAGFCGDETVDTTFGDVVHFCCEDLGQPVIIQLKAVDCFGNESICEVDVTVSNTGVPQCEPPADVSIACNGIPDDIFENDDSLVLNLYFGTPTATGNCNSEIRYLSSIDNRDECGIGTFIRRFKAVDGDLESAINTQTITLTPVHDYVLNIPKDETVFGCVISDSLQLSFQNTGCDQIGLTYDDQKLFFGQQDFCYKIRRDYTILVECEWDGVSPTESLPRLDADSDGFADAQTIEFSGVTNTGYYTYSQFFTVIDTTPPTVNYNGPNSFCTDLDFSHGENSCQEYIELPIETIDNCSDTMIISWMLFKDLDGDGQLDTGISSVDEVLNQGQGTFSGVLDVYSDYGVAYFVTDECGNMMEYTIVFDIVDCVTPTVHCGPRSYTLNPDRTIPITPEMMVDNNNGELDYFDNCDDVLRLSFSSDINDTFRIFSCDQVGVPIFLEIWVTDDAGNHGVCTDAELTILDDENCFHFIEGRVHSELNSNVTDVQLLTNRVDGSIFSTNTSTDGIYQLEVEAGYDYSLVPNLNNNTHSVVSTLDLLAIRDHILGTTPFTSPYQYIAADANRSKSISGLDMVELRRYILWQYFQFPQYPSWRFVDADYNFPNPNNPFYPDFPEVKNFNNLDSNITNADFLGVIIGDVNGSWENVTSGAENRSHGSKRLLIDDKEIHQGDICSVKLKMDASKLTGVQFALEYDNDRLSFLDIKPSVFGEKDIGLALLEEGVITTSWMAPADFKTLYVDDFFFEVYFKAKVDGRLSDLLSISPRYMRPEAYGTDREIFDLHLDFIENKEEQLPITKQLTLYQNVPNPFSESTEIAFSLSESSNVILTIQDVSGRVVKVIKGTYSRGMHKIVLSKISLGVSGVLYYQLSTPNESAVRRMVIL